MWLPWKKKVFSERTVWLCYAVGRAHEDKRLTFECVLVMMARRDCGLTWRWTQASLGTCTQCEFTPQTVGSKNSPFLYFSKWASTLLSFRSQALCPPTFNSFWVIKKIPGVHIIPEVGKGLCLRTCLHYFDAQCPSLCGPFQDLGSAAPDPSSKPSREPQEQGYRDICIHIADSLCYTAETNTTLWSNYTPIKMFKKRI